MAITDYATLQEAVADVAAVYDQRLHVTQAIQMAEVMFNRDLRHWRMEARQVATASEQYLVKPSDWLETIRMQSNGSQPKVLELISRDEMADRRYANSDTASTPLYYTHSAGNFELFPTPSAATVIELLYYAKITPLSDNNTTNWLITEAPDAYLYGALVCFADYTGDPRKVEWLQLYNNALQRLNSDSERARHSGSGLRLKIRSY